MGTTHHHNKSNVINKKRHAAYLRYLFEKKIRHLHLRLQLISLSELQSPTKYIDADDLNHILSIISGTRSNPTSLTTYFAEKSESLDAYQNTWMRLIQVVNLKSFKPPSKAVAQRCSVKMRLWYRCFPVIFVKFLGTPFLTEQLWWLPFPRCTRGLTNDFIC